MRGVLVPVMLPSSMPTDLASVTFDHTGGAEREYGRLRSHTPHAPWLDKVVFVESHRHGRLVIHGTFAGHYLDLGDDTIFGERDVEIGVVAGAIIGAAFGPAGLAAGIVVGGAAGAHAGREAPPRDEDLFDEIRALVPEGSSAIVLFAEAADADAMEQAFAGSDTPVVRHELSADEAAALSAAVANAPLAASPASEAG
jgi:Protein of unknown function (DUF1269)